MAEVVAERGAVPFRAFGPFSFASVFHGIVPCVLGRFLDDSGPFWHGKRVLVHLAWKTACFTAFLTLFYCPVNDSFKTALFRRFEACSCLVK